jgi:hypothetical protein
MINEKRQETAVKKSGCIEQKKVIYYYRKSRPGKNNKYTTI